MVELLLLQLLLLLPLFVLWAIGASNTSLFPFLHLPFLHSVLLVLQTPFLHFVMVELLLLQLLLLLPLFVLWAIGASNASLFPLHLPFLHSVFLVLQTPFVHFVMVELLQLLLL